MAQDIYRVTVSRGANEGPSTLTAALVETCPTPEEAWRRLRELTSRSGAFHLWAQWKAPEVREEFLDIFLEEPGRNLAYRRYFIGPPPLGRMAPKIDRLQLHV